MARGGSRVVRRQLGSKLRRLRIEAGKSPADVEAAGLGSQSKTSRMEAGKGSIKVADVRTLCWLYGADQATTEALAALAPGTQQEDWWQPLGSAVVPDSLGLLAGLEAIAQRIRCFEPEFVHGLVQTEAYAHSVIAADDQLSAEVISQRLRFRMERQATVLGGEPAPEVVIVLGEAALLRTVGSPEIMAAQIEHLRQVQAEVRVLPFSTGAYPRRGPIALLDFDDPDDPPAAYVEYYRAARTFEGDERAPFEHVFNIIYRRSIPIKEWNP